MYNKLVNNYICNYLSEYQVQKKHIERVLSAKKITNNNKRPYQPKFLKLKLSKHLTEEEKKNKIKKENRILFYKIIKAEITPSKYSKIYEPKKCPSFNKNLICFKRIIKEIENYKENVRFYNRLERVKSFYENKELTKRNKLIDSNIKKLHKSILELQPSLLFLSPNVVKRNIQKYKNITYNISRTRRCNSCYNRQPSKTTIDNKRNESINKEKLNKVETINEKNKNNELINSDNALKQLSLLKEALYGKKKDNDKEKIKIIENNLNNVKDPMYKIKANEKIKNNKKIEKSNKNRKVDLFLDKNSKKNIQKQFIEIEKPKPKKIKYGLKRNTSEINIFK